MRQPLPWLSLSRSLSLYFLQTFQCSITRLPGVHYTYVLANIWARGGFEFPISFGAVSDPRLPADRFAARSPTAGPD